jgi:hypothetical protein
VTHPRVSLDELERWELFGAHWRLVGRDDNGLLIDLCACTGEPIERREARDPALIEHVLRSAP